MKETVYLSTYYSNDHNFEHDEFDMEAVVFVRDYETFDIDIISMYDSTNEVQVPLDQSESFIEQIRQQMANDKDKADSEYISEYFNDRD